MDMSLRVGIVGCGLIGQKRAKALGESRLVACADLNPARAQQLAAQYPGCRVAADWRELAGDPGIDLLIVATTNDCLAAVTEAAVGNGKHVLVEKPAARNSSEIRTLAAEARRRGVKVKVGFNHRFHPALQKAWSLFESGKIGPLMYIRGRYGHGGRIGYDREWRADPKLAGGGELLDQGVHLIDLARWFAGDFTEVSGHIATYFWNMPVEDNGFAMLKTTAGQVAWLHASCTEWKNLFSFEIYGRDGKLQIDGLGGSYGVERLTFYRMLPQMGPPETTAWEYPGDDSSWKLEYKHLVECIADDRQPLSNLDDAVAALEVVEQLYDQSAGHEHQPSPRVAA